MDAAVINQHVVHFEVGFFTVFLLQRQRKKDDSVPADSDKVSFNRICRKKRQRKANESALLGGAEETVSPSQIR